MSVLTLRAPLLSALKTALYPLGYRLNTTVFRRQSGDLIHLIEVQSAGGNAGEPARFTINVGVFVPALIEPELRASMIPSMSCAHWWERLGRLSPEHEDLWWTVRNRQEGEAAAEDMVTRVTRHAIPLLKKMDKIGPAIDSSWRPSLEDAALPEAALMA